MADVVVLEAIGIPLPDVTEVANSQSYALQAEVQSQHLAKAESISRMGTEDVVPYPILRYLIIALTKLRTEHQANHWQVCLVRSLHRETTSTPQWNIEGIVGSGRQGNVNAETSLSRIVPIPVIIQETKVCAYQAPSLQVKSG